MCTSEKGTAAVTVFMLLALTHSLYNYLPSTYNTAGMMFDKSNRNSEKYSL